MSRRTRFSWVAAVAGASLGFATAGAGAHAWQVGQYRVHALPTLGGTAVNGANSVNDRGWLAGSSDLPGDAITHAVLWRDGQLTDLGTLGGPNSAIAFPTHSDRFVVGIAETADINPYGEDWSCDAFFVGPPTHHDCLGFVWEDGQLSRLPTLGGYNGFAAGSNHAGQIVGWAEDRTVDPTCVAPQVLQFRAVLWDAATRRPHELSPLPGDSTSAAVAINDRGQVVGISGACGTAVGGVSAAHAVLWNPHSPPIDLGNLGGTQWNTPDAINDRGVVVGFANVSEGASAATLEPHAFVWSAESGIRDLGTLPGDQISEAEAINNRGEIVGLACQSGFVDCHAVLWVDGRISDLNDLAKGISGTLVNAGDINDRGEIAGAATTSSGASVPYLATPEDGS